MLYFFWHQQIFSKYSNFLDAFLIGDIRLNWKISSILIFFGARNPRWKISIIWKSIQLRNFILGFFNKFLTFGQKLSISLSKIGKKNIILLVFFFLSNPVEFPRQWFAYYRFSFRYNDYVR